MNRRRLLMDCTPKGGINPNELDYLTIVVESDYCEVWPYPMQLKMEDNTFVDSVLLFSRNGGSWTSIEYDEETGELIPLTLRKGDVVRFKGNGYDFTTMYPIWFDSLGAFRTAWNYGIYGDYGYYSVQGTPLSLWYGDDFKSKANEVLPESCFCELFANGVDKLIRINNPKTFLPYTNLSVSCYDSMFVNCSRLLNAPVLPATKIVIKLCIEDVQTFRTLKCLQLIFRQLDVCKDGAEIFLLMAYLYKILPQIGKIEEIVEFLQIGS